MRSPRDVIINLVELLCRIAVQAHSQKPFSFCGRKLLGWIGLFVNQGYPLPGLGVIHPTTIQLKTHEGLRIKK